MAMPALLAAVRLGSPGPTCLQVLQPVLSNSIVRGEAAVIQTDMNLSAPLVCLCRVWYCTG